MINNDDANIIIKSISRSLKTEIKFLTLALTMSKSKRNPNLYEERTIVVLLGKERFFILLEDFKAVKLEFEYNAISKVYIDSNNPNAVMICLDTNLLTSEKKVEAFQIFVKNRPMFIKSLLCYHSIYYMEKFGEVSELIIKEKLFYMALREDSLLNKGLEMIHNYPENFKKVSKQGAEFFIRSYEEGKENPWYITTTKGESKFVSKVTIEFGEVYPVDRFSLNKDERDIHYYAYHHFLNHMRLHEKNTKFWVTKSEYYNKKFNLNIDKGRWEGFRIEARTAEYENQFENNKKDGTIENIVFLYLRRKFIPPFFDSYIDILITLREPYEADNYDLSYDAELVIDTIADSLHFPQKTMSSTEYQNILEAKLEALLLDEDTLEFFYNNLKIYGKDCYKCAMDYIYYLLFTLEKHNKDKIEPIKEIFVDKLKNLNLSLNAEFDFPTHDKYMRNNDIDTVIRDFEMKINTMGSNEYYNQVKAIWEVKLWRYFVFCVDGGLTNDRFNLEEIINIYKKVLNSSGSIIYFIQIQINNMLNIRITNHKDQPLDSKISTVINQMNDIKTFSYNDRVMNLLIKTGMLKSVQKIENDSNFANFIKFMLDSNPSLEFLKALAHFLRDISVDFDSISGEQLLRKSLNTILSSLMNIYGNTKSCPLTLVLACKCLTILTCADIDKNNKTKILQDNVIEYICFYLQYQDEKLLFCSLKLLLNILPELRENIGEILYKNSNLIPTLIGVLAGTGVPKTYHSLKSIQSVVIVLMNLLKMQPTLVKEKLTAEKNRIFVKYLLNYITEDDCIGEKVVSQLLPLQKYIFLFFIDIIKKNTEMKNYFLSLKIINIFQNLAEKNLNFLIDLNKEPEKTQAMYGDLIDPILKKLETFLTFAFYFINGDKDKINQIKNIGDTENYFMEFIFIANENKSKELVSKLAIPVSSLYNELNYQELDDDDD